MGLGPVIEVVKSEGGIYSGLDGMDWRCQGWIFYWRYAWYRGLRIMGYFKNGLLIGYLKGADIWCVWLGVQLAWFFCKCVWYVICRDDGARTQMGRTDRMWKPLKPSRIFMIVVKPYVRFVTRRSFTRASTRWIWIKSFHWQKHYCIGQRKGVIWSGSC